MNKLTKIFLLTCSIPLFMACGGGDGDDGGSSTPTPTPTPQPVPDPDGEMGPIKEPENLAVPYGFDFSGMRYKDFALTGQKKDCTISLFHDYKTVDGTYIINEDSKILESSTKICQYKGKLPIINTWDSLLVVYAYRDSSPTTFSVLTLKE